MRIHRHRILLIEGNSNDRQYIEALFLQTSQAIPNYVYAVDSCGSLKEAIDKLSTGKISNVDVVLLDLDLPDSLGLNTFHVVSRLCENSPIIILSQLGDNPAHRLAVLQAGALGCIFKPDLPVTRTGDCYEYLHRVITQAIATFKARERAVEERVDAALIVRESELEDHLKVIVGRYARQFKYVGLTFTLVLWVLVGIILPSINQRRVAINPSGESHGSFLMAMVFWVSKYPEMVASFLGKRRVDEV